MKEQMTNELSQRVVAINRVTKVVKGGRNFSFSALVVTGDGKGRVGIGKGKAGEVPESISKAGRVAEKSLSFYHLKDNRTIPHQVTGVFGAVKVVLRPAGPGTGLIAGGPVRSVLECVGVKDILSKRIGSRNPHNLVKATVNALSQLMDKSADSSETHKKDERASLKNSKSLDKNKAPQENAPQKKKTESTAPLKTDSPSSKSKEKMKWTKLHEMKVFLIYKQIQEGRSEEDLCQELKQEDKTFTCSLDSIKMKIRNIESLDAGKGLENVSSKNKEIFKQYKDHSIEKLKEEIKKVEETGNA